MTDGAAPIRLLLLEDSGFDAELLRETLRASHPQAVVEWVTGRTGFLQALDEGTFDAVLSDHEIPGFSGLAALEFVRQRSPELPFIFVSGVIGEDNAVELLKRGATDYVSKSRMARLPVVIDRALRESAGRLARRQAEAQLREADLRYAGVVDSLPDYAVILLDPEGRVRLWNRAATEIFGHTAEAMIGRSADLLFLPEDQERGAYQAELDRALATGKAEVGGWRRRRDGSLLRADGVCTPLFADDGSHTGFCKLVHDATVAYERSEALRAAKDEAERANRAKDRFLAMLSHELRTPLTPIVAAAHVLERFATVPDRYRDLLPMIQRNVALESRLIEDLLDLTSVSSGKVRLSFVRVDMHALTRQVADMLDSAVQAKSLVLELHLDAPNPVVRADEARMHQVLSNIVRNAVKFTPVGGRVTLSTANEDGAFVFRCADTGIGIPALALPRIFRAFEQAEGHVGHEFGGLGLGLAIASGLVEEHQGRLIAASDGPGRGAEFTLVLAVASEPVPADAGADACEGARATPCGGRVLLVEDSQDAAEALAIALEGDGYVVTRAASVAEASAVSEAMAFDAVVTDIGLPDGSGLELARALSPRLPVVVLSGYGTAADRQASKEAGCVAHIVKPADPELLSATLAPLVRPA